MDFEQFASRAHEIYDAIPDRFREGVDGLVVERGAVPHPELPEIWTLGECRTEQYPSDFGGAGSIRSFIVLFHGSFRRLADQDDRFHWEDELYETITHELKHHLESLASEDALEVEDWVMDQNFARRQGESFDPSFFRSGIPITDGAFEVDGDLFLERILDPAEDASAVSFTWEGERFSVPVPADAGDTHFLTVEDLEDEDGGEFVLVLIRRRGFWRTLQLAVSPSAARPTASRARLVPGV
jgi:hypothetical protein